VTAIPDTAAARNTALPPAGLRGHSYATILIDMDTHRPVDVLDDRQASTLSQWLKDHPGVQVICRDRAGAYAEGAREGAPEAIQVADRFHLWQNLCDAVEKTVISCRADLNEPAPGDPEPAPPGAGIPAETAGPATSPDPAEGRLAVRARERHAAVHDLLAEGRTHTQICAMLGLSPKTVRKSLRAATPEQVTAGPRPPSSGIDRFAPYLHERWNQGCSDAVRLHAEIQARGYHGSSRSVRRYLQPLRATLTAPVLPPPRPTVREVTRWITSHPGHLTDDETAKLNTVKARSTHLSATAGHVTAFAEMMTGRHGEHLPPGSPPSNSTTCPAPTPSPAASAATRPPSPTASPWPTAAAPSRATSAASKPSNARCSAGPASTSCENESCSAPNHAESPVHDLCARALKLPGGGHRICPTRS
jgi:Transposase/Homeodomain-like domain